MKTIPESIEIKASPEAYEEAYGFVDSLLKRNGTSLSAFGKQRSHQLRCFFGVFRDPE